MLQVELCRRLGRLVEVSDIDPRRPDGRYELFTAALTGRELLDGLLEAIQEQDGQGSRGVAIRLIAVAT